MPGFSNISAKAISTCSQAIKRVSKLVDINDHAQGGSSTKKRRNALNQRSFGCQFWKVGYERWESKAKASWPAGESDAARMKWMEHSSLGNVTSSDTSRSCLKIARCNPRITRLFVHHKAIGSVQQWQDVELMMSPKTLGRWPECYSACCPLRPNAR